MAFAFRLCFVQSPNHGKILKCSFQCPSKRSHHILRDIFSSSDILLTACYLTPRIKSGHRATVRPDDRSPRVDTLKVIIKSFFVGILDAGKILKPLAPVEIQFGDESPATQAWLPFECLRMVLAVCEQNFITSRRDDLLEDWLDDRQDILPKARLHIDLLIMALEQVESITHLSQNFAYLSQNEQLESITIRQLEMLIDAF
jgi:hypothetical protein